MDTLLDAVAARDLPAGLTTTDLGFEERLNLLVTAE